MKGTNWTHTWIGSLHKKIVDVFALFRFYDLFMNIPELEKVKPVFVLSFKLRWKKMLIFETVFNFVI